MKRKQSPQAKYQKEIRALMKRGDLPYKEAQSAYRQAHGLPAPWKKKVAKSKKKKAAPKEINIFKKSGNGELWTAVENSHRDPIELRLQSVRAVALLVHVDLRIFTDVNTPWKGKTLTFTTTHEDFWTDFYDTLRDDFEGDEYGSSYNVGAISVTPI